MNSYAELKKQLLANPEALMLIAIFVGVTCHAWLNREGKILASILGALISFPAAILFTLIFCWKMGYNLADVWFLGFPVAFMTNYFLGGMSTVGKQISEKPLDTVITVVNPLIDKILESITKFKTPKV